MAKYWIPMAALIDADSPQAAHEVMNQTLAKRRREQPEQVERIELVLGPLDQVQVYTDALPASGPVGGAGAGMSDRKIRGTCGDEIDGKSAHLWRDGSLVCECGKVQLAGT